MARPTKYTPEIGEQIVRLIKHGVPITHAAAAVGVSESTVYAWITKGQAAKSGRFSEFSEDVTRAKAASVAALVARVAQASEKDWRAAAWLLTRRAPAEFVDPARLAEMQAAEARAELTVAESVQRVRLIEARAGAREGLKRKP